MSIIISEVYTKRLEASVTHSILTQLDNLGWVVDETDPECNVFQQRAKTDEQKKLLKGKMPDFMLYQKGTNTPIAIIEAKKPDETLTIAIDEAERKYAKPLEIPLIFAHNDTFVATRYLNIGRPLKIDGEDVRQLVDHYTALRFIQDGPEIFSVPPNLQYSREQLITIFKQASNLLREAGLQAGLERFGAFSDILFLKIMDEVCELKLQAGEEPPLGESVRWSYFKKMAAKERLTYLKAYVWPEMKKTYGEIFGNTMPIDSPEILDDIVKELAQLNLLSADTDVKGDAFEYFLKNAYQGISIKDLGEYFTPRNIVRTMVSMVNPKFGDKIYDPFCGTGGFLIESFKYLRLRMKPDPSLIKDLKENTVFGSEITTNARIAKMNMILFGDGSSNVVKEDSLANPKRGKYDIVLTNPPYSQKTRYGNYYPGQPRDGDAVCVLHCFDSLNDSGRACILVKEDFLSDTGDCGRAREYILSKAKNFSVVSLPRKLFIPYTPTKTNMLYFEKAGKRDTTFFYVVRNVGHTLTTRKKSIPQNDLPKMLDSFRYEQKSPEIESYIVNNTDIENKEHSLWVYDYFEVIPGSPYPLQPLSELIMESGVTVTPSEFPDEEFTILGVSNRQGIIETDTLLGREINGKVQQVKAGDIVYNPHRVNVGSIGVVPPEFGGGYVSNIYVVFRPTNPDKTPFDYIAWLLKSLTYRRVIEAYDTKHGAVRANLTYSQLQRIRMPILDKDGLERYGSLAGEVSALKVRMQAKETDLVSYLGEITTTDTKKRILVDYGISKAEFHSLLGKACKPINPKSDSERSET